MIDRVLLGKVGNRAPHTHQGIGGIALVADRGKQWDIATDFIGGWGPCVRNGQSLPLGCRGLGGHKQETSKDDEDPARRARQPDRRERLVAGATNCPDFRRFT